MICMSERFLPLSVERVGKRIVCRTAVDYGLTKEKMRSRKKMKSETKKNSFVSKHTVHDACALPKIVYALLKLNVGRFSADII